MGIGFGIVAISLAMASISFACTAFLGDMTFTVPGPSSHTVTGAGSSDPGAGGMTWCGGEPTWTLGVASGVSQALGVSSATASGCTTGGNNYLPDGTYDMGWAAGYQPPAPNFGQHINCHNESANNVFGVYTVAGNAGAGSVTSGGTWTPAPATSGQPSLRGYANVCVYMIPVTDNRAPANAYNFIVV